MVIKNVNLETVCGITSKLPDHTLPEIAFAGKSNVGKSSLINALMNRKALARTSTDTMEPSTDSPCGATNDVYCAGCVPYRRMILFQVPFYLVFLTALFFNQPFHVGPAQYAPVVNSRSEIYRNVLLLVAHFLNYWHECIHRAYAG